MNLLCVLLVDMGLAAIAVGVISLLKPLRFLRVRTRSAGAALLAAGVGLAALGILWPAGAIHIQAPPQRLDEIIPEYQFGELHETRVHASAEATFRAIRTVTAGEIRFFGLLTWIRSPHLSGRGRESILNAPSEQPLLDVALRSGFFLVAEDPSREVVVGMLVCCDTAPPRSAEELLARSGPGLAKAFMNFRVDEEPDGVVRLTTQTRVFATDAAARRRFAAYWRTIYPGSAFIRRMWLAAIKKRAESGLQT
jgi:hypothetical protein